MTNPGDQPADLSAQIERSLGSIWQRRTGARPASISVDVRVDAVRCAIEPGTPDAVEPDAGDDENAESGASDSYSFRHESIAAVTKIMHRPISAFIDSEDAKQGTAKQTFIFERAQTRF